MIAFPILCRARFIRLDSEASMKLILDSMVSISSIQTFESWFNLIDLNVESNNLNLSIFEKSKLHSQTKHRHWHKTQTHLKVIVIIIIQSRKGLQWKYPQMCYLLMKKMTNPVRKSLLDFESNPDSRFDWTITQFNILRCWLISNSCWRFPKILYVNHILMQHFWVQRIISTKV